MCRSGVFEFENFLAGVKANMERHGRCVVAVSEGISDAKHTPIATTLATHVAKDPHGNVELGGGALADLLTKSVKDKLGFKRVRGDTFGYVQRSFMGCVSDVDQREAREVGEKAMQYAMWADRDGSVTIHRAGNYAVNYELSGLAEIAGKTKVMPDEFIAASGDDVTPAFDALSAAAAGHHDARSRPPASVSGGENPRQGLSRGTHLGINFPSPAFPVQHPIRATIRLRGVPFCSRKDNPMLRTKQLFVYVPLLVSGIALLPTAHAATTANPKPTASERAAAKTGNEIDKAIGPSRPVTSRELRGGVSLSGISNPAQALATAQIKNREGEAIGTVSSVDVAPDGKAQAIHVDVGGFPRHGREDGCHPCRQFHLSQEPRPAGHVHDQG